MMGIPGKYLIFDIGRVDSVFPIIKERLKSSAQIEQLPLLFSLGVICVVLTFMTPMFFTVDNMMNILRAASLVAITGIGMVLVILVGEIDLSVGSVVAVVGIAGVWVLNATGSFTVALLVSLGIGALTGLINGVLVVYGNINSLIATLGTMAILRGVAMVTTQARSIQAVKEDFADFGAGYWGPFPKPLVIAFLVFVLVAFILNHTGLGRYIYAVGGNANAAKLAGIPVARVKMITFISLGMLAALTGLIIAARMSSGQPSAGTGWEFQVVAAVILGGISLTGGKGSLLGAVTGILILSVLQNGLILLNVSSFYHDIVRGAVIILAVYIDERRKRGLVRKLLRAKSQDA